MLRNHSNAQLANNTILGSVFFNNNTQTTAEEVEYDVAGNRINGSLNCSGNNPAPDPAALSGEPNNAAGGANGQCSLPAHDLTLVVHPRPAIRGCTTSWTRPSTSA